MEDERRVEVDEARLHDMGTQVGAAVELGAIVGVAQIEFAAILVPKWEKIATGIHILLCLKPFPTALHIADEPATS